MRKLPLFLLLALSFVAFSSFEDEEIITDEAILFQIKNGYAIRIDGFRFDARDQSSSSASLSESNGTIVTNLTFYGNSVRTKNGSYNPQRIDIAYAYAEGAPGNVSLQKVQFEFNKQKYFMLPTETTFTVKEIDWANDHKSFALTAEFDAKVKQMFANDGNTPILNIKGKIEKLRVEVPAVILDRLPKTSASIETGEFGIFDHQ